MKLLSEFKNLIELEEKQDFSKFDALIRAGLGNKAQIQRLHTILGKMSEEKPNFSVADRAIIQNIFNKMVDLITNNSQIFRQTRKAVSEEIDEPEIISEDVHKEPPFILLLKRTAVRLYPGNLKVATYHNQKLDRDFAIPFKVTGAGDIQSEEIVGEQDIVENVMDTLHKIVDGKSAQKVKFATGETRKVDQYTASAITQVHKALNTLNKKKFADMVHKSPGHFSKASDFAFSKAK